MRITVYVIVAVTLSLATAFAHNHYNEECLKEYSDPSFNESACFLPTFPATVYGVCYMLFIVVALFSIIYARV